MSFLKRSALHKPGNRISKISLLSLFFLLPACGGSSNVEFIGKRKDIQAQLVPTAIVQSHQGGAVNGKTASGYDVSASLGTGESLVKTTTSGGYQVRLNYPGQISQ